MADGAWYAVLVVAGFVAGVVNTIAGGGSFLTLPALMLFGLDPKVANGTNRVAVLFSSASAVATFNRHGHLNRSLAIKLTVPTLLGVPVGALLAIFLPSNTFEGRTNLPFAPGVRKAGSRVFMRSWGMRAATGSLEHPIPFEQSPV